MKRYVMPPEWAPHTRTWMAWPCAELTYGETLPQARREYADVALAIAQFEPLTMLYDPESCDGIDALKGQNNIDLVECPLDDSWLRDNGPTFVLDEDGALAGVDWVFDGWGGEWPHDRDAKVAARVIELAGAEHNASEMIYEGGALNIDDKGTCVVTRQCYEHRTRNGGPTPEEFEKELCDQLGLSKVIWLNRTLENDSTNGHVDVVAAFVPGGILCQVSADPEDSDYENLLANRAILESETDAEGNPLVIHQVTSPPVDRKADGSRRFLSYINFYLVNGGVIVPQYGFPEHDKEAMDVLAGLFPDRKVVGVMTNTIADGGGNIHCITQQQPKAGASSNA
ncbi:agmatine deiminase family protein [Ruegeria arenilitoris]|uniref:agmatine deiminase family protein n=1 Tax=Ruegeria arenilitoris TaxID=1173585 RepID=UPI001479D5FC|nr:agmatine deiminase family protein [Ruegeria arenilitoris]